MVAERCLKIGSRKDRKAAKKRKENQDLPLLCVSLEYQVKPGFCIDLVN
jgi:hypothetical protein